MILALDIGGTSIKAALIDEDEIIRRTKVPTKKERGYTSLKVSAMTAINELLSDDVTAIGISCAGDINPFTGKTLFATQALPGFTGQNLKNDIAELTGLETYILNDAMCALVGEMYFGGATEFEDVIMVTLGTGVGGEVAKKRKILLGNDCRGSRLGHIVFQREKRPCPCGKTGCAETFISATGLIETAKHHDVKITDCNELFDGSVEKEKVTEIVDEFTSDLAEITDIYCQKYPSQLILIGGGLVYTGDHWFEKFLKKRQSNVLVRTAKLGNDAGLFGAYMLTKNAEIIDKS